MASWLRPALGAIGMGLFFNYMGIPAGALIGAIFGSAVIQFRMNASVKVPRQAKRILRVCVGCLIGLSITREGYSQLQDLLLPILVTVMGTFIVSWTSAFLVIRVFKMKLTEAFLGTVPAGAIEMSINAEELNGDPVIIAAMHLFRLISIISLIPFILMLFK